MLSIIKKDRELVVEENDVLEVLKVINEHLGWLDGQVGNCRWADESSKWFIAFCATDKKYGQIMEDLTDMGDFKMKVRPGGKMDMYFEKFEMEEETQA